MRTVVIPPVHYHKLYRYSVNKSRTKLDLQMANIECAMKTFHQSPELNPRKPNILISSRDTDKDGEYFGIAMMPLSNFENGYSIALNKEWELVARKRSKSRKNKPAAGYVQVRPDDKE